MGRGLDGFLGRFCDRSWYGCAAFRARPRGRGLDRFPVAMARGKHLFPFRTEQLSPSAPMVLGSQGPGRVGRRRFFLGPGLVDAAGPASVEAGRSIVRSTQ